MNGMENGLFLNSLYICTHIRYIVTVQGTNKIYLTLPTLPGGILREIEVKTFCFNHTIRTRVFCISKTTFDWLFAVGQESDDICHITWAISWD